MSQQSNLILNDGQTTPVAHTFSARGADLKLAVWEDISSGIRIGLPRITIGTSQTGNGASGSYKVQGRIIIPVLEALSGDAGGYVAQPQVAFNMFAALTLVAPNRCNTQNRKDLRAYTANLLAHAVMTETFVNFDPAN